MALDYLSEKWNDNSETEYSYAVSHILVTNKK